MQADTQTHTDMNQTAVEFPTRTRAHIALAVTDLPQTLQFYRILLGVEPSKLRPGYAKFEPHDPPLNLTLNAVEAAPLPPAAPAHFGVQVKSTQAVLDKRDEMDKAGFGHVSETGVGCCYAVQDKVWFQDPDGRRWEVFVVTQADTAEHTQTQTQTQTRDTEADCCPPTCCT